MHPPPPHFPYRFCRYVVVLTKADKSDNSVSRQVLDGVVSALREAGVSRTPVLLTSSASKLGRDGMWRCAEVFGSGLHILLNLNPSFILLSREY